VAKTPERTTWRSPPEKMKQIVDIRLRKMTSRLNKYEGKAEKLYKNWIAKKTLRTSDSRRFTHREAHAARRNKEDIENVEAHAVHCKDDDDPGGKCRPRSYMAVGDARHGAAIKEHKEAGSTG
jgi:hypothetical protein